MTEPLKPLTPFQLLLGTALALFALAGFLAFYALVTAFFERPWNDPLTFGFCLAGFLYPFNDILNAIGARVKQAIMKSGD